jgi:AcrR family transcriptional regulator
MAKPAQRKYHSPRRQQQAGETRDRILDAARRMILSKGFSEATIEAIAGEAGVAPPTVYAVFGSKRGIVQGLMERAAFSSDYGNLVREAMKSDDPETRLRYAAKIARKIHDSLRGEIEVLRGAAAVAPEFLREKEHIRYERQAGLVKLLAEKGALRSGMGPTAARDILWTLTSHDIHRRLVGERKWSSDKYEEWLGDTLVASLLAPNKKAGK